MSVGTIVTIVLLMTVLLLGLVLVRSIFKGATNAVDLTDAQLTDQVNKLFSEDKSMVIYPGTSQIDMKRGDQSAIGIGVKNRLTGGVTNPKFNYKVFVDDPDVQKNCGVSSGTVQSWIQGATGNNIDFPIGDNTQIERVLFNVPQSAPLCSVKIRVEITLPSSGDANYATDSFFMTIQ